MKRIVLGVDSYTPEKGLCLCLGNFDGVHLGHQKLIIDATLSGGGPTGVVLFSKSPAEFLSNGKSSRLLTSLDDKERLFAKLRVDYSFVINVDESFFSLSPDDFMKKYLLPLSPEKIYIGTDFRFGKGAQGNKDDLAKHFIVVEEPLLSIDGEKASSQKIISLIEEGRLAEASRFLGRPYEVKGKVVSGFQNGRKIGFPTANLSFDVPYALPKDGVYLGMGYVRGIPYQSIINVGKNPTVGLLKEDRVEAYLKGLAEDIYGETMYLEFDSFLREEKKFASLDELKKQLEIDLGKLG